VAQPAVRGERRRASLFGSLSASRSGAPSTATLERMSDATIQEVKAFLSMLEGDDAEARHQAKLVLGGLLPDSGWPVEPLVEALNSQSDDVVLWTIVALGRLETRSTPAIDLIANLARGHRALGVRQAALKALSNIEPGAVAARSAIFAALADESALVRREALQSSISVPAHTQAELTQIAEMAADSDESVSRWSEIALRNIRVRSEQG
jgi:HEAT repeat protein